MVSAVTTLALLVPHAQATLTWHRVMKELWRRPWPPSDLCLWPSMPLIPPSSSMNQVNSFKTLATTRNVSHKMQEEEGNTLFSPNLSICLCVSRTVWWARVQQHRVGPWCTGCGLRQWQRTGLLAGQEQVNTQICCSCFKLWALLLLTQWYCGDRKRSCCFHRQQ